MAEEGKAKYAAEVWELIRLFSRLGKTVYGLLLLLVGWMVLLQTGREVLASSSAVDGLWLPSIVQWWPLELKWYHPSVSFVATGGVILLLVWWVLHSRLTGYVWAPVRHVVKPVSVVAAIVIGILLGLLNLLLLPVVWPLIALVRRSRRQTFRANWIRRRQESAKGETPEQHELAWTQHLDKMKQEHGAQAVEQVLVKGSWDASLSIVVETGMRVVRRVLAGLLSRGRVGLAPITAQSYSEEFLAAKLPLQLFAQAITRVRAELGELALLDDIHFVELPPSAQIQQYSQAERYAWLFDTDVLLWGTYKPDADGVISLNLSSRLLQRDKKEGEDRDEFGNQYQRRFFPWSIEIDFPALSFRQDDEEDVYLVLLVTVILVLQGTGKRWDAGWRKLFPDFQWLDRLRLRGRGAIEEILLRVIPPALARLGKDALPERSPATGRHALVDVAGQWVGRMLNTSIGSGFEELARRKGGPATFAQLRALAESCARLDAKNPIAHYRTGALRILTNDKDGAVKSFRKAGELDRESFEVHGIGASVAAKMTVMSLQRNEDIALAVWAAHAACAINTGSDHAINGIREMVEKKLPAQLYYQALNQPEPIAVAVVRRMLPPSPTK